MPNADTLEFLFATVATIIATLTGLIGVFSTFRLQNINAEISLLKGFILDKKLEGNLPLREYITGESYHLLEKIYDRNNAAIALLDKIIEKHDLGKKINEFRYDLSNLLTNQKRYDTIKGMTIRSFALSLIFVLGNLILLFFNNRILIISDLSWYSVIYFFLIGTLLFLYVTQIAKLIE